MSALIKQTNSDGLTQRYGKEEPEGILAAGQTRGKVVQEFVLDFKFSDITANSSTGMYDADASGGSTPDSFSDAVNFIPAGSAIVNAYLVTTVAWTGTATIDIGFETKAGAAQDEDGLYDGLDVDSATVGLATAGANVVPNGVVVQNTTGTFDPDWNDGLGDHYVRVINADAGTLTAGEAKLVIEYINYQS